MQHGFHLPHVDIREAEIGEQKNGQTHAVVYASLECAGVSGRSTFAT
jgi:hypothetical protein